LREVDFIVDDANWQAALAVSSASARARSAVTRDIDALEAANRPRAPRETRYETYVVQRGETLTGLARRFRTTPAVLMQLNQLTTGDIDAGQRLRVPSVTAPTTTP
jgi:LysM repeat protein